MCVQHTCVLHTKPFLHPHRHSARLVTPSGRAEIHNPNTLVYSNRDQRGRSMVPLPLDGLIIAASSESSFRVDSLPYYQRDMYKLCAQLPILKLVSSTWYLDYY